MPDLRITRANAAPLCADGDHVLYWMNAARQAHHNFALDRAIHHATELGKPLIVLEALRSDFLPLSQRFERGGTVDSVPPQLIGVESIVVFGPSAHALRNPESWSSHA